MDDHRQSHEQTFLPHLDLVALRQIAHRLVRVCVILGQGRRGPFRGPLGDDPRLVRATIGDVEEARAGIDKLARGARLVRWTAVVRSS